MKLPRPYLEKLVTQLRTHACIIALCRSILPHELEQIGEYLKLVERNCPHANVAISQLSRAFHRAQDVIYHPTKRTGPESLAIAIALAAAAGALQQALECSTCSTTQQVPQC